MTQKESKRKVQVWTHNEILSSHQNYQVTQVTMNMANHFVCSRLASKEHQILSLPFQNEPLPKQRFYFSSNSPICHTWASSLLKTAIVGFALVASILLAYIITRTLRFACACARLHFSILSNPFLLFPLLQYHAPPSWIEGRTKTRLDGHPGRHACLAKAGRSLLNR